MGRFHIRGVLGCFGVTRCHCRLVAGTQHPVVMLHCVAGWILPPPCPGQRPMREHAKKRDTSPATRPATRDGQTAWDTFPSLYFGVWPQRTQQRAVQGTALPRNAHTRGLQGPRHRWNNATIGLYFNYVFILIVGRLAIILLTASRLLFFRGFGAKWRGVSSIKHQFVLWPGQQHFKVSFVSLNEPWCPQN